MAKRPRLTVTDAIAAFEVERRTLQRLLTANQLDGARKDERGRWIIPVEALHAAGLTARQTWISDATKSAPLRDSDATNSRELSSNQGKNSTTVVATAHHNDATDLRQRIAQLEAQLDTEKRLREASERNADDLRSAMRMLEAGPRPTTSEQPVTEGRRRWWKRS